MQAMNAHGLNKHECASALPLRVEGAAPFLPGRVRTMIHLAWLSGEPRMRAVAGRWHSITAVDKAEAHIAELCRAFRICDVDFIGIVARTTFELASTLRRSVGRGSNPPSR